MPQPPTVTLTDEERTTLETFVHRGKANARTLTRARILLKSAEGWSTAAFAAAFIKQAALMFADDSIGNKEAHSSSVRLGGEVRLEESPPVFGCYPGSTVDNLDEMSVSPAATLNLNFTASRGCFYGV